MKNKLNSLQVLEIGIGTINMNFCFIISMYNEHQNVLKILNEVDNKFTNPDKIIIHSFDKESEYLNEIKTNKNCIYIPLENLGDKFEFIKLGAYCISRNFSKGFNQLYQLNKNYDCVVVLTGDTEVFDATNFERRYNEMLSNNVYLNITQSIGCFFFAQDHYKEKDQRVGTRYQHNLITDIMPQFFMIDYKFAYEHKCFNEIKVVNEYCSEQCLGDEVLRCFNNDINLFHKHVKRLNDYKDGIIRHVG